MSFTDAVGTQEHIQGGTTEGLPFAHSLSAARLQVCPITAHLMVQGGHAGGPCRGGPPPCGLQSGCPPCKLCQRQSA